MDFIPMLADVTVLKSHVVGTIGAPTNSSSTARIEAWRCIMSLGMRAIALPIRRASSDDSSPTLERRVSS